ncbi:MAG: signal peptide peptidase SppA [Rubritepida sp.]|nr:signal peptide peptidase SppA [Rubritepida sp.]
MGRMEADQIIDRRRLKRRLTLWRVLAVLGFTAVIWMAWPAGGVGGDYVARLDIRGTIADDRRLILAIDQLATNDAVRAVIVAIDSPGGSVAGGEAIHAALTRVAAARPVVATMGATAASAGYMVALPAARIFAREGTLTGSIGVILQTFEASDLLARLGVRPETIASGPLKDQPSPFRPLTEEGRAALNLVVQDMYGQFVRMVAAGRRMSEDAVRAVADGRVLSGARARDAGLVDAMGGEREARAWLAEARDVPLTLPVRAVETRPRFERLLATGTESLARALAIEWLGPAGLRAVMGP